MALIKKSFLLSFVFIVLVLASPYAFADQRSSKLGSRDPNKDYYEFKRTFQVLLKNSDEITRLDSDDTINLSDCGYGDDEIYPDDDNQPLFSELAFKVVRIKLILTYYGYPSKIWQPYLIVIEGHHRELIKEGYDTDYRLYYKQLDRLMALLNKYRIKHARHLPKVRIQHGCGDYDFSIKIAQEPKNGRIWLIPVFNYKLCQVKNIDPDNSQKCFGWEESTEDLLFYPRGEYHYMASWPDGFTRKGILPLDEVEDGQTLTIKKL
ncbi:MAG: hypothetical protein HOP36_09630 [Methyloglobulus sp.]|nr:hypothetical protein [Methyloglobulus sp.]